jgi:pilus assembly protein CpaF
MTGRVIAVLSGAGGCENSILAARLSEAMDARAAGSDAAAGEELDILLHDAPRRNAGAVTVLAVGRESENAAREADIAVITAKPDIISLKRARACAGRLKEMHLPLEKIKVVLDTFGNPDPVPDERAQAFLGTEIIASMPFAPGFSAAPAAAKLAALLQGSGRNVEKLLDKAALLKLKNEIHAAIIEELRGLKDLGAARGPAEAIINGRLAEISEGALPREARPAVAVELLDKALGLGCLEKFISDPAVTEIMVNGPDAVYVEIKGKLYRTDSSFDSPTGLMTVLDRIVSRVGRRVDESSPLVDARLADGSRVNAVIPPLALNGPVLTIRKFSREKLTMKDLIAFGALTEEMAGFIRDRVLLKKNIVVSGGTGTGKTTLLNVISSFIPPDERIITIEDSAELRLPQEHVVRLESRPASVEGTGEIPIRKLVINALRMRPDRIIVGECRGGEALDMLQAMNTGHDGSMTTVHANSPKDAVARICTMAMMSGVELTERAVREQTASAIHVIIQLARFPDGSRKVVGIAETKDLFK